MDGKRSERLSLRRATGLASILALGLVGCTGDGDPAPTTDTTIEQVTSPATKTWFEYTDDGQRIEHRDFTEDDIGYFHDIYAACDGRYIIERTNSYSGIAGTQARTLAEDECADGQLTPEDFMPSETKTKLPS